MLVWTSTSEINSGFSTPYLVAHDWGRGRYLAGRERLVLDDDIRGRGESRWFSGGEEPSDAILRITLINKFFCGREVVI